MALTEKSVISKIEVLEDGQIQVQQSNIILRDGVEIAKEYHRHVLAPGDDLTSEDPRVQKQATAAWTDSTVSDYLAAKAATAIESIPSTSWWKR